MNILMIISCLALGGVIFYPIGYRMGMKRQEKLFNKSIDELKD